MRMLHKLSCAALSLVLLQVGNIATNKAQPKTSRNPFSRAVPSITLRRQTMFIAIAKLYESTGIVVSVERVLGAEPAGGMDRKFTVTLKGGKPRQVLDEICRLDNRYTWSRDGGVVNVYPRSSGGDPRYLFNRKILTFHLTSAKSAAIAAIEAADQVTGPRPQLIVLQTGGLEFDEPWTVTLRDLTLRQAINRVATHLCEGCGWQLTGAKSAPTIVFYRKLVGGAADQQHVEHAPGTNERGR